MGTGKFAGTDFYAGSNFAGTKNYSHWGIVYKLYSVVNICWCSCK